MFAILKDTEESKEEAGKEGHLGPWTADAVGLALDAEDVSSARGPRSAHEQSTGKGERRGWEGARLPRLRALGGRTRGFGSCMDAAQASWGYLITVSPEWDVGPAPSQGGTGVRTPAIPHQSAVSRRSLPTFPRFLAERKIIFSVNACLSPH